MSEKTFDDFWAACPRKVGKGAARTKWKSAIKVATPDEIIAGMERAASDWRFKGVEKQFIPHPATWLSQERWDDEQEPDPAPSIYSKGEGEASQNHVPISIKIYNEQLLPEIMETWERKGYAHWWHVAARMKQARGLADVQAMVQLGLATPERLQRVQAVYDSGKLPPVLRALADAQERSHGDPAKHTGKQEAA